MENQQRGNQPSTHAFTIEAIIADIDKNNSVLTPFTRTLLTMKLKEVESAKNSQEEAKRISDDCKQWWRFLERKFYDVQSWFDQRKPVS